MRVIRNDHVSIPNEDLSANCNVYLIHVQIEDIDEKAKQMIDTISNTSWLSGMDIVDSASLQACASRTISKFVNEILNNVNGQVDTDFGEIMVSDTAQCVLNDYRGHYKPPLADLIKERVSGNGGFDFHTESQSKNLIYGEAKYSGCNSRYTDALKQINQFIQDGKDIAELITLKHFVSREAVVNSVKGVKGFTAAFSLVCNDPTVIFDNAISSLHFKALLNYSEIYLIGVEVCA